MDVYTRFNDLVEYVQDDPPEDNLMTLTNPAPEMQLISENEWSHGPLHWNTQCSLELQQVVDIFCLKELYNIKFSVTVADPMQADSPLVACSSGFSDLSGYMLQEIVGRNCRFLLNGVPPSYINEQTRFHARDFCIAVHKGLVYDSVSEVLPVGVKRSGLALPKGEIICMQTNARKDGGLFKNMFYMKQVWLDDKPFIIGLQAGVTEEYEEAALQEFEAKCLFAWKRLGTHMTIVEQILCSRFWYSGCMRRQDEGD